MLNVYAEFCEKYLAMPVVKGVKTAKERFAGAEDTYTIEALMHDGKALQSGTSHYFGDGLQKRLTFSLQARITSFIIRSRPHGEQQHVLSVLSL